MYKRVFASITWDASLVQLLESLFVMQQQKMGLFQLMEISETTIYKLKMNDLHSSVHKGWPFWSIKPNKIHQNTYYKLKFLVMCEIKWENKWSQFEYIHTVTFISIAKHVKRIESTSRNENNIQMAHIAKKD